LNILASVELDKEFLEKKPRELAVPRTIVPHISTTRMRELSPRGPPDYLRLDQQSGVAEAPTHVLAEQHDDTVNAEQLGAYARGLVASQGTAPAPSRDEIAPLERLEVRAARDMRQPTL